MMVVRVLAVIGGLAVVVGTFFSAIKTVVVPRATSSVLTRVVFVATRRVFELVAHERRSFTDRDRVLALYAPLTLVMLPMVWVVLTIGGFTAIQWGVSGGSLREAFLVSGSSMLTLGTVFRRSLPAAAFTFGQAALGLVLVALLISYLPTIYGSFARREALVGLLESRAGIPPSPVEMLTRYNRIGALDDLDADLFVRFEQWFIELEESHTSFGSLIFFRSPVPERSWITAAGCVLDTSALYLSVVDRPWSPRAALCLRTGFLSLGRIASYFKLPIDVAPSATDPISVSRREFDLMYVELMASGIPLKADREKAWVDYQGWRVNYDKSLVLLAKLVFAPPARWSSDRDGPRITPTIMRRRGT